MPLRLRLAVVFALGTTALIATAGLVFLLQLRASLDASVDSGLRARARTLAADFDTHRGEPFLLGQANEIAQLLTVDGHVLTASRGAGGAPLLNAHQREKALAGALAYTANVAGTRSRLLATSATMESGQRVLVVTGTSTEASDAAIDHVRSALLLAGPPAVLLSGVAAWLLAGAALRPVERMRRQAAEIQDRDTGHRLAVPATRDELAALATTMNSLLERLQGALARERRFVADASHELRTPLAILCTELELAARPGRSQQALVEAVTRARRETERVIRLAEDLLFLARADTNQPLLHYQPVSLPDLLAAAARGAHVRASQHRVGIQVNSPGEPTIQGDPERLRQALDNLLDNAIRHAPAGSVIELSTATAAGPTQPAIVLIQIADRGPGFPPEFLPHAFERFHRADPARARGDGGAGLGLSIVRAIAQAHGGRASASNRAGSGAVLTIELPTTSEPSQR